VVLSDIDRRLLNRCIAGAPGAWEDFVDRFIALITHVVSSTGQLRLGQLSEQTRDDVVAEVFLKLVDKDFAILRRFKGQSSLGTYLVVVVRRIAVRRFVKISRTVAAPLTSEPASSEVSGELTVENTEEVQSLLSQMPVEEATAIRMYHLEDRTYRDISTQIGIPENSVGPLLYKARTRLRSMRRV
jgi:RNA polymerase sigma-70 factor, ECF subfamily